MTAVRTNRNPTLRPVFFGLLAGALIGVMTTWALARRPSAKKAAYVEPSADETPGPRARPRLNAGELPSPQFAPAERVETKSGPPDPVVEQRRVLDMLDTQLAAHRREPVDASWAAPAARSITTDFQVIQTRKGVKVNGITCRSHTCTAELEWPSRDRASGEWRDVLMFPYRNACAKMVILPPPLPGQESGPVKTTMLFECAERKGLPDVDIAPPEEYAQAAAPVAAPSVPQ